MQKLRKVKNSLEFNKISGTLLFVANAKFSCPLPDNGRSLLNRYDVHGKLVSFMAPIERGIMPDSSRFVILSL